MEGQALGVVGIESQESVIGMGQRKPIADLTGTIMSIPKTRQITVSIDGLDVVLIDRNSAILRLPWDAAIALGQAMIYQGRQIEESVKADKIIQDQAFLMRMGIPLGLTSNPIMLRESLKEAVWDSKLRRYIPTCGVGNNSIVGAPKLRKH